MAKAIATTDLKARSIELATSARQLGKDIHTHLMAIARHIASPEANGDVSLATHFVTLLMMKDKEGESRAVVRADAVKNWLEAFAFCQWGKTKDGKEGFKLSRTRLDEITADHFKVAASNPWNVYTKAKPFQIFDLDAAMKALLKRAKEKAEEQTPEGVKHKIDVDHLAKLEAMIKEIGA